MAVAQDNLIFISSSISRLISSLRVTVASRPSVNELRPVLCQFIWFRARLTRALVVPINLVGLDVSCGTLGI